MRADSTWDVSGAARLGFELRAGLWLLLSALCLSCGKTRAGSKDGAVDGNDAVSDTSGTASGEEGNTSVTTTRAGMAASTRATGGTTSSSNSTGNAGSGGAGTSTEASSSGGGAPSSDSTTTGEPLEPTDCSFDVDVELSSLISTVGIVQWDVDLENLEQAFIDFGRVSDDQTFPQRAPVDLSQTRNRTLLLGMKSTAEYAFRIVANSALQTCTSETFTIQTGPPPSRLPGIDREVFDASSITHGFFIVSELSLSVDSDVYIFDEDGDEVWWEVGPVTTARARMSWDGNFMWMQAANLNGDAGEMRRVSMDGLDEETIGGLEQTHHDFAVLPDGGVVAIAYGDEGPDGPSRIIKREADGEIVTVVEDVSTLYPVTDDCHPEAIQYDEKSESFTIAVPCENLFVAFDETGTPLWQLGGATATAPHLASTWQGGNHGHQLLDDGHFLFFGNRDGAEALVLDFQLDFDALTATEVWRYESTLGSSRLGDVQRVPGGNTLVTYSLSGVIHDVAADNSLAQTFTTLLSGFGYLSYRPTLYGPPPG